MSYDSYEITRTPYGFSLFVLIRNIILTSLRLLHALKNTVNSASYIGITKKWSLQSEQESKSTGPVE